MKLLLLDGNSILNRAFFALSGFSNSKGFPTNAIFGFHNILDKILKEDKFTHVVAAFDLKGPTFRHKQYKEYKANRKKMPNELFLQLEETKKMLHFLGINICEMEGFEADDVLGTLSKIFSKKKIKTVIATGDRDLFQLINENVIVRLFTNKEAVYYDEAMILKKYGVTPKQLIEVKALMGDSSDNIPGVLGIGEKTALKLIQKYKTIETIFNDINNLDITKRVKNLLLQENAKNNCFLSKSLGTIRLNLPLKEEIEEYERKEIQFKELINFLKKFELNKILKSYLKEKTDFVLSAQATQSNEFKIIKNPKVLDVLNKLKGLKYLDFYLEENLYIFARNEIFEFSKELKKEAFIKIISNSSLQKRTTNIKDIYNYCYMENLKISNVIFSCDLAAYLVDVLEENFTISNLALKYSKNYKLPESFIEIVEKLEEKIAENDLNFVLEKIEIPLSKILSDMEMYGILINKTELFNFGGILKKDIEILKEEIFKDCDMVFNLNSTKELADVLFNKLGLKKGKKTKTGYSTDITVLEKLVKHNPVVSKIIEYREKSKLISTYVDGLEKLIQKDGAIHSNFNQTKTKTGRISSQHPNIQNIPVKTELGENIRKFFTARDGYVLIDADYSQIELRILAQISNDEKMIKIFNEGGDIHSFTAKEIFGFVNKETRNRAKTINFSVIYGVTAFSLAKDIGVSVLKAKEYINAFFEGYKGVKEYFDSIILSAQNSGYVKTLFGRLRKVPEINSKSKNIFELGKRIVKNTPIQGTAADVIKLAMISVKEGLEKEGIKFKIVLQVHDEILIEVLEKEKEKAKEIVQDRMKQILKIKLPLECNIGVGKTWFDAKI